MKTITNIKMTITHLLLTVAVIAMTQSVFAQSNNINLCEITGECVNVTSYAETERFLWIGTENGLYQVKRKNMKVSHFTENNSQLPSNHITAICARSNGEVYIGTDKGMMRYDRYAFIVVNTENSKISSDVITALYCDKDDNIWIGSITNSLSMIKYVSMKNYKIFSSPESGDHIVSFANNNHSNVILVMESGNHMKFSEGRLVKTEFPVSAQVLTK